METQKKEMIIKILKRNPLHANIILQKMGEGQKIGAIKELLTICRAVPIETVSLSQAKAFIEEYFSWGVGTTSNVKREKFISDVTCKDISDYKFEGIDIRQVDTKSLKQLLKSLKRELKKRGKKI